MLLDFCRDGGACRRGSGGSARDDRISMRGRGWEVPTPAACAASVLLAKRAVKTSGGVSSRLKRFMAGRAPARPARRPAVVAEGCVAPEPTAGGTAGSGATLVTADVSGRPGGSDRPVNPGRSVAACRRRPGSGGRGRRLRRPTVSMPGDGSMIRVGRASSSASFRRSQAVVKALGRAGVAHVTARLHPVAVSLTPPRRRHAPSARPRRRAGSRRSAGMRPGSDPPAARRRGGNPSP